jgi:hypothetical protein
LIQKYGMAPARDPDSETGASMAQGTSLTGYAGRRQR